MLSAAHCFEEPDNLSRYRVGHSMHKLGSGWLAHIHHISNHPSHTKICGTKPWNPPDFDFSIIHLASPVDFSKKVLPACLPDKSLGGDFLAGKDVTVSGWGLVDGGYYPGVLYKVTYPAITNEKCKQYNDDSEDCSYITTNMLCAGNPLNRTASHGTGDSGGSIQC